jgi:6-phosphogluconolactonase
MGQTVSTLPKPFKFKGNSTAEVVVHPSGKFVYGSNRGHNSIAIFALDAKTGALTPAGHQSYAIDTPRNFAIDPTGKYLLAASQGSSQVAVFAINPQTGALTSTGSVVDVPVPVCIRMMAPK